MYVVYAYMFICLYNTLSNRWPGSCVCNALPQASSPNILRQYSIGKHGRHELSLKNVAVNRHAGQIKATLQQVCGREEDARNLAGADATRPTFLTVCCEN